MIIYEGIDVDDILVPHIEDLESKLLERESSLLEFYKTYRSEMYGGTPEQLEYSNANNIASMIIEDIRIYSILLQESKFGVGSPYRIKNGNLESKPTTFSGIITNACDLSDLVDVSKCLGLVYYKTKLSKREIDGLSINIVKIFDYETNIKNIRGMYNKQTRRLLDIKIFKTCREFQISIITLIVGFKIFDKHKTSKIESMLFDIRMKGDSVSKLYMFIVLLLVLETNQNFSYSINKYEIWMEQKLYIEPLTITISRKFVELTGDSDSKFLETLAPLGLNLKLGRI